MLTMTLEYIWPILAVLALFGCSIGAYWIGHVAGYVSGWRKGANECLAWRDDVKTWEQA